MNPNTSPGIPEQKRNIENQPKGQEAVVGVEDGEVVEQSELPIDDLVKKQQIQIGRIEDYLIKQDIERKKNVEIRQGWQKQMKEAVGEYSKKTQIRKLVYGSMSWLLLSSLLAGPWGIASASIGGILGSAGFSLSSIPIIGGILADGVGRVVSYFPMMLSSIMLKTMPIFKSIEEKFHKSKDEKLPEWQKMKEIEARNPDVPENRKVIDFQIGKMISSVLKAKHEGKTKPSDETQKTEQKPSQIPAEVLEAMKNMKNGQGGSQTALAV